MGNRIIMFCLLVLMLLAVAPPRASATRTLAGSGPNPSFKYLYNVYFGYTDRLKYYIVEGADFDDTSVMHQCAKACTQVEGGMCKGWSYCWDSRTCYLYARLPSNLGGKDQFSPTCASGVWAATQRAPAPCSAQP